jgi:hypothetical protein
MAPHSTSAWIAAVNRCAIQRRHSNGSAQGSTRSRHDGGKTALPCCYHAPLLHTGLLPRGLLHIQNLLGTGTAPRFEVGQPNMFSLLGGAAPSVLRYSGQE